jgi:transposase
VNDVLAALDRDFSKAYADGGRPSIPPERLLRALLLQGVLYTIRSESLIEELDYNLPYRWFVGLGVDEPGGRRRLITKTAIGCSTPAQSRMADEHEFGDMPLAVAQAYTLGMVTD